MTMENFDEFSKVDRSYIETLKDLLDRGDVVELEQYIIDYDDDFLYDDEYMLKLKNLVDEGDIDEIENMILSSEDYIHEFSFDDESEYDEDLYNCKDGCENKYEDEILSEDNETASDMNDNIDLINESEFTGVDLEFEDLEDLDLDEDFDV